jgi:hypothetical protein
MREAAGPFTDEAELLQTSKVTVVVADALRGWRINTLIVAFSNPAFASSP